MAGGAAGAIGALGIILAFNFGGKPIYVMPLVFGGAPVVNTFTTVLAEGTYSDLSPLFLASLIVVIAGAATVLIFAPRHAKPAAEPKAAEPPQPAEEDTRRRPTSLRRTMDRVRNRVPAAAPERIWKRPMTKKIRCNSNSMTERTFEKKPGFSEKAGLLVPRPLALDLQRVPSSIP